MLATIGRVTRGAVQGAALGAMIWATPLKADTIADAMIGAYNHSGLLEQNRAILRAADEDVATAASALQPVVTWTATMQRQFARSTSAGTFGGFSNNRGNSTDLSVRVNASLLLYDWGASKASIEAAKQSVLATRQGLINIEQQVLLRAAFAHLNLRQAAEIVALRENNLRLLTQELRAARDRFEVGDVTRTDVALAEARLAQARSGLASAQGDRLKAIEEYRNVVGRKPGAVNFPRHIPKFEQNADRAKAIAVRQHPSMKQAQFQVAATEFSITASSASLAPTVTLNGTAGLSERWNSEIDSSDVSVGVTVQGTLYNGGRLSSALRRSIANRDAARGNLHVVRHNVQQDVGVALADVLIARASLEASERQIRAARVAFRGVREEATVGTRTTLDVLDAEQELLDAEASRISAQTQQYSAAYAALAAMGMLTAEALQLPVQKYDPEEYYNLVKDGAPAFSKQGKQLDKVLRALQKD